MKQRLDTVWMRAGTVARIFISALREIFDEAAYARFLIRTQMTSSTHAYTAFRHECEEAKTRHPKCC